jgi:hypothetical protein
MIAWWLRNFANIRVKFKNVPGFEEGIYPAYYLWHPEDHIGVKQVSNFTKNATAKEGSIFTLAECMDSRKYGYKFLLSSEVEIFSLCDEVKGGGMCFGGKNCLIGHEFTARICLRDEPEGVVYHYEIAAGLATNTWSGPKCIPNKANSKVKENFYPELFAAWHQHNTIEVSTFEHFLPALYA